MQVLSRRKTENEIRERLGAPGYLCFLLVGPLAPSNALNVLYSLQRPVALQPDCTPRKQSVNPIRRDIERRDRERGKIPWRGNAHRVAVTTREGRFEDEPSRGVGLTPCDDPLAELGF